MHTPTPGPGTAVPLPDAPTLPRHLTAFVGRRREVDDVRRLLADPACRLVTLVGPGGIGKTRLALEVTATILAGNTPLDTASDTTSDNATDDNATDIASSSPGPVFADGAVFVPLQSATDRITLITAIAQAIHSPLSGAHDPLAQLIYSLADKDLLLLLDNLEHLLDELDLLADLLAAARGVKILATSRTVLNLAGEWLYPLEGLAVPTQPDGDPAADLSSFEAVQLFVERARRVRPGFALEAEAKAVAEICHLVGGLPLALELAAAWLNMLSAQEIAAEIRRSLDFLTSSRRDISPRHQSIRAVFDHSWRRLTPTVSQVLMQLAVFRGGFQRDAAAAVAGATLPTLSTLIAHSLLRWEPDTRRYQCHELLRQYALEQLDQTVGTRAAAQARYAAYYVDFLAARTQSMLGGDQHAAIRAIEPESDNIRAAWQWAIEQTRTDDLIVIGRAMTDYYQVRSRYLEGAQTLAQATTRLLALAQEQNNEPDADLGTALALLLTYQGSLEIRLGRIDAAAATLHQAQAYYDCAGVPPLPGYNTDPRFSLGIIALIQGDYATAARYGDQVRQTADAHDHPQNRQLAHYLLACAVSAQGDLATAQRHGTTAYELARTTGGHWFMAYCLNELGDIALALGDYAAAHSHYTESYAIRAEFADPEGMAIALVRLGQIALAQGNYSDAQILYQKGLQRNAQIDDKGGLATALAGLGRAAVGLRAWEEARARFHAALDLALAIHYLPCLLEICYGAALLWIATGDTRRGLALLATVAHHPSTPRSLADQIEQKLGDDLSYLAPDFLAMQRTDATPADLEQTARDLLAALETAPSAPIPSADRLAKDTPSADPSPLVEPLSERELELLQLIAAGHKNREIAEELIISINTVKVHIGNIYGKLGVNNRVQAVARARELALI